MVAVRKNNQIVRLYTKYYR